MLKALRDDPKLRQLLLLGGSARCAAWPGACLVRACMRTSLHAHKHSWVADCSYMERISGALSRKAGGETRLLAAAKEAAARGAEAKLQLQGLAPKVGGSKGGNWVALTWHMPALSCTAT